MKFKKIKANKNYMLRRIGNCMSPWSQSWKRKRRLRWEEFVTKKGFKRGGKKNFIYCTRIITVRVGLLYAFPIIYRRFSFILSPRRLLTDTVTCKHIVFNNNNNNCPSTGKCGLVPQHVHCHRLITHCSHFFLNFQLPTGLVLVG